MRLTLTTPERQLINEDNVEKVTIPTSSGEITVLPGHISIISALGRGEMLVYKKGSDVEPVFVSGGVLQVADDNINILANMAEKASEIDEAAIEEAIRRAKENVEEEETDVNIADVQAKLANDLARLKLASKYRGKRKSTQI